MHIACGICVPSVGCRAARQRGNNHLARDSWREYRCLRAVGNPKARRAQSSELGVE